MIWKWTFEKETNRYSRTKTIQTANSEPSRAALNSRRHAAGTFQGQGLSVRELKLEHGDLALNMKFFSDPQVSVTANVLEFSPRWKCPVRPAKFETAYLLYLRAKRKYSEQEQLYVVLSDKPLFKSCFCPWSPLWPWLNSLISLSLSFYLWK